jgi:orotate phosphoribosyltransferase
MQAYQREFLAFAIERKVLRFGEFTLKSGRVSPYFFDTGQFNTGETLARLGRFYADAILASGLRFEMLFGPAYKGIALVAAVGIALAERHGRDVPFAFNRKEIKDHGEGGAIIGAPIRGRVLIIDDVVSAGTSVREAVAVIDHHGGAACGVAIALDREEGGQRATSARDEIEHTLGLRVISIASLTDLLAYLSEQSERGDLVLRIGAYRNRYGVAER